MKSRFEIERKFVITAVQREKLTNGVRIRQGYISFEPEVRVRIKEGEAYFTVKGEGDVSRKEFEYAIPVEDAHEMLDFTCAQIEKVRYRVGRWEVDFFEGKLAGLILAEIELVDEGEAVMLPEGFVGIDVSHDPRFKNKNLARLSGLGDLTKVNGTRR